MNKLKVFKLFMMSIIVIGIIVLSGTIHSDKSFAFKNSKDCAHSCKGIYKSCKYVCESLSSNQDICMDGCMRDYDWCVEDCYED